MKWTEYDLVVFINHVAKIGGEAEEQLDEMVTQQMVADNYGGYTEEMVRLANMIEWSTRMEKELREELHRITVEGDFVALDADTNGEYIVQCARLHGAWNTHPTEYFQGASREDITHRYYLLGNIEGHLLAGKVTLDMIQMLDLWADELHEKEEA